MSVTDNYPYMDSCILSNVLLSVLYIIMSARAYNCWNFFKGGHGSGRKGLRSKAALCFQNTHKYGVIEDRSPALPRSRFRAGWRFRFQSIEGPRTTLEWIRIDPRWKIASFSLLYTTSKMTLWVYADDFGKRIIMSLSVAPRFSSALWDEGRVAVSFGAADAWLRIQLRLSGGFFTFFSSQLNCWLRWGSAEYGWKRISFRLAEVSVLSSGNIGRPSVSAMPLRRKTTGSADGQVQTTGRPDCRPYTNELIFPSPTTRISQYTEQVVRILRPFVSAYRLAGYPCQKPSKKSIKSRLFGLFP